MGKKSEDDDEETGYGNQDTVDIPDYTTSAPASLVMLNKRKSNADGQLSIVQLKQRNVKNQSHLGLVQEEKEDESAEYK